MNSRGNPHKDPGKMTAGDIMFQLHELRSDLVDAENESKRERARLKKIEADGDAAFMVALVREITSNAKNAMRRAIRRQKRINELLTELARRRDQEKQGVGNED